MRANKLQGCAREEDVGVTFKRLKSCVRDHSILQKIKSSMRLSCQHPEDTSKINLEQNPHPNPIKPVNKSSIRTCRWIWIIVLGYVKGGWSHGPSNRTRAAYIDVLSTSTSPRHLKNALWWGFASFCQSGLTMILKLGATERTKIPDCDCQ